MTTSQLDQTTVSLDFSLQPHTEAGQRLVALAEEHAADFAGRAAQHDREASFPFENITALQKSGVLAACVPVEFGGFGVDSALEYALGSNRLARGDASTAIAATMHIGAAWFFTRAWRAAQAAGDAVQAEQLEGLLRAIGAGQIIVYFAITELATGFLHPLTTATRVDGGWHVSGHKSFGTMSRAAQLAAVDFRYQDPDGNWRIAFTVVPADSPGIDIKDDWDALGMRASGSHDTVITNLFVPAEGITDLGPWGEWNQTFVTFSIVGNLALSGAMLGIAEAAHAQIVETLKTRRKPPRNRTLAERPGVQHLVAENEIDLAAARAILGRSGELTDAFLARYTAGSEPMDAFHILQKDFQCAKYVTTHNAIKIVDRVLSLSGGGGYMSRSPLSRMYRDVRAGTFMQAYSPNEVHEYIGKVALGLDPTLDL